MLRRPDNPIPLNDLKRQTESVAMEIRAAVDRVVRSGYYIGGPEVAAFEREFADTLGSEHCVGVANGTDALELALRALGCRPGDEIITVANAGGYTTTAATLLGCIPVFADICPVTLQIDPASVAPLIGHKTSAIVVTHLYGAMAPVEAIVELAEDHGLSVVEDCAQAHGAELKGCRAGTFGDVACFSFYPSKNLGALGDGGALVCRCDKLAGKIRQLAQYGWDNRFNANLPHGRNSRLDPLQAAILRSKLVYLDKWNQCRRNIVQRYSLAASHKLSFPDATTTSYVAHLCVACCDDRETLRASLQAAGIATGIHYPVADHRQVAWRTRPWRAGDLSVTDETQQRIITLPCFPELTDEEVDHICLHLSTDC